MAFAVSHPQAPGGGEGSLSDTPSGGRGQHQYFGFNAVIASLDILIPPLFRRTNGVVRGDGDVACVTYADPTALAVDEPDGVGIYGGRAAPLRAGESRVEVTPAVRAHRDEGRSGFGRLDSAREHPFTFRHEEQQSVKQGLLEVLLGAADGAAGDYGGGRLLPAPTVREEANFRLRGVHCDATYITSLPLLLRLMGLILCGRTNPARRMVGCVASVDLSHTTLGTVGAAGPPLWFDEQDGDSVAPWPLADVCFYADQPRPWSRCSSTVRSRLAARSLALCYFAPLLFIPGTPNYAVKQLVCTHCQLTDADAEALATIMAHRPTERHQCLLESIDVSFNGLTDAGAAALLRALRKNRTVTSLLLVGNTGITKQKILDGIERRLHAIRQGTLRRRSWLARLFSR